MATNSGFLGCGNVIAAPYNPDGSFSNLWYSLGTALKYALKENFSDKEMKSKACESYGQLSSSIKIKEPAEFSLTLGTMSPENFAILFAAEAVKTTIAAGAFDVNYIVGLDRTTRIPSNILTLVVTTSDGVTTTYVEGVDYVINNADLGLVTFLDTGAITDGQEIKFAGTTGERVMYKMKGGTAVGTRLRVMLYGNNLDVGNQALTCEVFDVILTPDSEVDFLADDFTLGELTGKPIYNLANDATYEVDFDIVNGV